MLATAKGKPVYESYLAPQPSELVGPLTYEQFLQTFSVSAHLFLQVGRFHFYHSDLEPTNIMMTKEGDVAGVIDWESADYYPAFWIATKPSVSADLDFDPVPEGSDSFEWRKSLRMKLERQGFSQAFSWFNI